LTGIPQCDCSLRTSSVAAFGLRNVLLGSYPRLMQRPGPNFQDMMGECGGLTRNSTRVYSNTTINSNTSKLSTEMYQRPSTHTRIPWVVSPQEDSQSMLLAGTGQETSRGWQGGRMPRGPGNNILYLTGYQVYTHPLCNSLEDKVIVFTEDRSSGRSTACLFCRGRCVTGQGGGGRTCPTKLSNLPRAREKNTPGLAAEPGDPSGGLPVNAPCWHRAGNFPRLARTSNASTSLGTRYTLTLCVILWKIKSLVLPRTVVPDGALLACSAGDGASLVRVVVVGHAQQHYPIYPARRKRIPRGWLLNQGFLRRTSSQCSLLAPGRKLSRGWQECRMPRSPPASCMRR
jgi:hypothetical protein